MLEVKKYYIQYQAYATFVIDGTAYNRKLYNDNKEAQTGEIRLNNEIIKVHYHY